MYRPRGGPDCIDGASDHESEPIIRKAYVDHPAAIEVRPPSQTANVAALCRAVHSIRGGEPKLLADGAARGLLGFKDDQSLLEHFDAQPLSRYPGITTLFALRNRYAEDELAIAVARGATQYVILGAGLDSFAYRCPELMDQIDVFEVDHPGSQAWKRRRVAEMGLPIPGRLHYVPVDLERDILLDRLQGSGFDRRKPVFASLLGVSQYLTEAALSRTLGEIAALSNAGCTLVLEHIPPFSWLNPEERVRLERATAGYAAMGEPWLTFLTADAITTLLRARGFVRIAPSSHADLRRRYLESRTTDTIMPCFVSYLRADIDRSAVP